MTTPPNSTERLLRVGIIGSGSIASAHATGYQKAGADLVAVCDINETLAQERAKAWDVPRAYGDVASMIAQEDLDAVSIATPVSTHHALTVQAAEAGLHVLCEKPIAVDLDEARAMIDACTKAGVVLQVGHQLRSNPAVRKAKALIDGGAIGEITMVRFRQAHDWGGARQVRPSFATRASGGGGTLLDNGCHMMDLARHLVGDVEEVFARVATRRWPIELEDTATVSLLFRSGAIGTLEASWSSTGWEEAFWVYGTRGALEWTNRHLATPVLTHVSRESGPSAWAETDLARHTFANESGHHAQIHGFLGAIQHGSPVPCSGQDGLEAVRLILAGYDSAGRNAPVKIGEEATSLNAAYEGIASS